MRPAAARMASKTVACALRAPPVPAPPLARSWAWVTTAGAGPMPTPPLRAPAESATAPAGETASPAAAMVKTIRTAGVRRRTDAADERDMGFFCWAPDWTTGHVTAPTYALRTRPQRALAAPSRPRLDTCASRPARTQNNAPTGSPRRSSSHGPRRSPAHRVHPDLAPLATLPALCRGAGYAE